MDLFIVMHHFKTEITKKQTRSLEKRYKCKIVLDEFGRFVDAKDMESKLAFFISFFNWHCKSLRKSYSQLPEQRNRKSKKFSVVERVFVVEEVQCSIERKNQDRILNAGQIKHFLVRLSLIFFFVKVKVKIKFLPDPNESLI